MYKLFFSLLLTVALCSGQSTFATVIDTTDRIVAIVNTGVITMRELDQKIQSVKHHLTQQKIALPADTVLRTQVLERMIIDMVQLQYAQQLGMQITDADLQQAIDQIAQQNKKTLAQFQASMEKQGYRFNEFRENIRQELLINRVREREIDSRIFVGEGEVNDWIKNQGTHQHNEYELAQILIPMPDQASEEEMEKVQQKVNSILRELNNGANFAAVAAKYSSSTEAMQGGSLGWRSSASLPPSFVKMLDILPIDNITEPIRTPIGIHIFKLLGRRAAHADSMITQTHAQHILIRMNEFVSEAEAIQRATQIRERLKNGAKFTELARLYSEDASAGKGGDIGWVSPGGTVPEFEQAMNHLSPGQISEPIRTEFGIHIITVLARRQQDIGSERERMQVRMELRQRKAEEQYQNWVAQLRDSAYVNIRLEDKA